MQFPPSNNRRELKNRGISTIRFQNLKYGQGNCMRRCWGTTPISGEVGLTARLHPLRRATPVTSRCTRYVALHPLRRAAPFTSRCTRYVALHPLRHAAPDQNGCIAYGSGALPTDRVHCLRIGCTAQRWNTPQKTLPPPHVSPTDRNSRSHKNPEPHPQQRDTGSHATPHNPRAEPANPTPDTTRPRPVSRPRPRRAHSAALSEAPPIRRSCPRDPRPRRGQPRGGRRGRGTASRTRSPGPRHGRSGSTAGRHRARRTRRA